MKVFKKLIFTGFCLLAAGCYYDTQATLYKNTGQNTNCDTTKVTYALRVAPIINANCSSCHSSSSGPILGGNIILDSFQSFQQQAVGGKLMSDINEGSGSNPMPKGGNKISDCEIAVIQHWIDLGTPNN